jgi:hypothetical protein
MTTEIAERPSVPVLSEKLEHALVEGDLSKLSVKERVEFYNATCESLGLNPLTKPFGYITLQGRLTLYALKACADQLRKIHGVSIGTLREEERDGVYVVFAPAADKTGRTDEDMGAVPIANLKGEALSNARMKAVTKAKRRVTLSICGLGFLDETETDSIPGARVVDGATFPGKPELQRPRALEAPKEATHDGGRAVPDRGGVRVDRGDARGPGVVEQASAEGPAAEDMAAEMRDRAQDATRRVVAAVVTPPSEERKPGYVSQAQIAVLMATCHRYDVSEQQLTDYLGTLGYESRKDIPVAKLEAVIEWVAAQAGTSHAKVVLRRRPPRETR